jgi:2-iminoacetate synthase
MIERLLDEGRSAPEGKIRGILAKADTLQGLDPDDLAALIWVTDPALKSEIYTLARSIKERIYGKRLVLFAPLYISDYCVNNCRYCGYRRANQNARRRLTMDEVAAEARAIAAMGHRRIALEAGEDPVNCPIDYVTDAMRAIYKACDGHDAIRRINVNIAATTVEDYHKLKEAGIGTYVLFQETYHRPTYAAMHDGPKADYDWHTTAMDRALAAGLDDLGIGVLFGLYDWRFEVMAMLLHARHLDAVGVGPHTISFPRLRPARGMTLSEYPHLVNDEDFKHIVACMRLAVPYTGMILSTREESSFRDEVIALGISQISGGSRTGVGEYSQIADEPQFEVNDRRSLDEVIADVVTGGYLPSFCTSCYRSGRTGERFMILAKNAEIHEFCQPNAILTCQEYLCDYASPATRAAGERTIAQALTEVTDPATRRACEERLARTRAGERDLLL